MLKCHYGPVLVLFFLTMLASGFQCRPFFSRKRSNLLRDKCLVSRSAAESPAPASPSVPVPKRKKRRIWHFINLTNGIELLHSLVHDCGVIPSAISFCRIQSSHCETCDFQASRISLTLTKVQGTIVRLTSVNQACFGSTAYQSHRPLVVSGGPSSEMYEARSRVAGGAGFGTHFESGSCAPVPSHP